MSETRDFVAVLSMAGRFPGAADVAALWELLRRGGEGISRFADGELSAAGVAAELRADPDYVPARGVVEGAELFDADFFGFHRREAEVTDPQHRVLLECAWQALEAAAYDPTRHPGPIGVFAGRGTNRYAYHLAARPDLVAAVGPLQVAIGNEPDHLPATIAYKLDLRGPAVAVQTACSTSLVAVHLACQSLLGGECDMALAGGVTITVPQAVGYRHQPGGILSRDGRCRPFDAAASGTVASSGAGVVLLKRLDRALADGDRVRAVIRGSAINNDGAAKVGYAAPGVAGQAAAIAEALAVAGVEPASIGYVEAHGTGTELGDPIEVEALREVFGGAAAGEPCGLGSLKGNLGHLDAAAGVAGLIKATCAVEAGELPPSLHFAQPNPRIDFAATPFRVVDRLRPWPVRPTPRRAGVSSFGIGGTNAHVVLEQAPPPAPRQGEARVAEVLLVSARSESALDESSRRLARHLRERPDVEIGDVAYTLDVGRRRFPHRRAVVASDAVSAAAALEAGAGPRGRVDGGAPPLAFLFPGQGAQRPGMAAPFLAEEPFRRELERCREVLVPLLGEDPLPLLVSAAPDAGNRLRRTALAQPCLFAVELALARLWMAWGLEPAALLGHSLGELVAACLAGVMEREDALRLVVARGRLVDALPGGAMLAVPLAEEEVLQRLGGGLALAAVNAADRVVVAGPEAEVAALEAALAGDGVRARRLATSHAFHSPMVEPALAPLREVLATIALAPPRLPVLSNVTGDWLRGDQATDPDYWLAQLRGTVRFADALERLLAAPPQVLLEVGPAGGLAALARRQARGRAPAIVASQADEPRHADLLQAVGRLAVAGIELDAAGYWEGRPVRRVELPGHPLARERFWVDPPAAAAAPSAGASAGSGAEEAAAEEPVPGPAVPAETSVLAGLREVVQDLVGVAAAEVDPAAALVELGFDSLALMQVSQAVQRRWGVQVAFRKLYADLPDLAALAAHVEERLAERPVPSPPPAAASPAAAPPPAAPAAPAPAAAARFGPWRATTRDPEGFDERQRRHVDDLVAVYTGRTRGSKELAQRHRQVLADVRVSAGFRQAWKEMVYPVAVRRAVGARLWDVDGNEYVDLVCGFGVNLFGHSPEWVGEALAAQLADGIQIGPQSPLAGEVAAMVRELTGHQRVAFCNTGSEAVMAAMRLARTATGRDRVAAFNGSYHGISDGVLGRQRGAAGAGGAVPVAPGIPQRMVDDLVLLDYGDAGALEAIEAMAGELAAVLVEPVQSGRPDFQPRAFLHRLREITRAAGVALVFDEMITGFRLHPRGAQGWFGVEADIATYGKVVGGGMPLGLVAGDAAFLDGVDGGAWSFGDDSYPAANQTFFAGTFCKHPLALAAARATLRRLIDGGPRVQAELNAATDAFVARLGAALAEEEVDVGLVSCGSMFRFVFPRHPLAAALFSYHLRRLGVHLLEDRGCFLSTAHQEADLAAVEAAVRAAVRALREGGLLAAPPAAPPRPEAQRAPMSDGQRGLWAVCRLGEGAAAAYNESLVMRLGGRLDREALAGALDRLARRHESLRTSFDPDGAEQRVESAADLPLEVVDLTAAGDPQAESRRLSAAAVRRPFDLARAPLARALLMRLAEDDHVLVLVVHHLVSDSWSFDVLFGDLARFYAALRRGEEPSLPPAMSYREYAERRRAAAGAAERAAAEEHWLRELSPPPRLDLPVDRPRPRLQSYEGDRLEVELGGEATARVRALASAAGGTPFVLLLGAFYLLLHEASGQEDLVAGFHSAGQFEVGGAALVGFCIDMLPLRLRVDPAASLADYLALVQEKVAAAHEARAVPFAELVRRLGLRRDPSRPPLVTTIFNLDRAAPGSPALDDLTVELLAPPLHPARFELLWNVTERPRSLLVECTYSVALFEAATVRGWLGRYGDLVEEMTAAGVDRAVGEVLAAARDRGRQRVDRFSAAVGDLLRDRLRGAASRPPALPGPTLNQQPEPLAGTERT